MSNKLVIVESPAKEKTLNKILGHEYIIKASKGHVRDLPEDKLGISIENDFEPQYQNIIARKTLINEIKELAKRASAVYLATDPDREGEAISWHLVQAAKLDRENVPLRRVTFHEITREAVLEAFNNPRSIDLKMVEAQQARRILDRLVGYKLSPLLWKKVLKGLSAGRVQSVAVRLVVDREREIEAFVPSEYWTIGADLSKIGNTDKDFRALLVGLAKQGKLNVPSKGICDQILAELKESRYSVNSIQKKDVFRNPSPPFITSTLQQEAYRKLRFSAKRTMAIAQRLYEGLPVGDEGDTGLITYMRTDSTNIATTAIQEIRDYITSNFSHEYLPKTPRAFARKVKMAQEAHEAIRPTKAHREPDKVKAYLSKEQFQLYELIWKRAIASQMSAAIYDTVAVDIDAKNLLKKKTYVLQTKASSLRFPGFMALYIEGIDEEKDEYDEGSTVKLPHLAEGEALVMNKLLPEQFFTQPPPRYTEATLIKALEQKGIGRPSTYAPVISTILDRGYVYKESGKLKPEEIGKIVNDLLVSNFPNVVDFNFTANMEDELDDIAKGKRKWVSVIKSFYSPFEKELSDAQEHLQKVVITSNETCPLCGKPMVMKSSRYGKFFACSNYPECKGKKTLNAKGATGDKPESAPEISNEPCPVCGKNMVIRKGRYGRFLACPDYPKCTGKQAMIRASSGTSQGKTIAKPEVTDEKCEKCNSPMVIRYGRFGKFLACSAYPKCKATKKINVGSTPKNVQDTETN